ncbi:unnamed protein product [Pocillopora meandrina]|uniref:C2H2-type domain-containing protein n=1 Tax=Pocillopora meandrina TaxID=46732 RepID=A0AAU9X0Z7_9CNID|nr:unnamed protein product [Pocillopora meandrina]
MTKVDHFVEFINRPYFYQDVSHGIKFLKLDSGKTIKMPNVVRTVTRSTMISQYIQFCEEEKFEPLSRTTLFKILEVRQASQRKSLKSEKHYLKTNYRVHRNPEETLCPDHCRKFALSDEQDPDFQEKCSHQHTENCNECQNLRNVQDEVEDKVQEIKTEKPHITWVYLRSDEAGCYHTNSLIAAARGIGKRVGLEVCRYDFSEPQYGKDVCDRILCPMKTCIRRFRNEGHDILSAGDMRRALSERPVKGTSAFVCEVDEAKITLEVNKIDVFSKLHNVQFEEKGIRVWRSYRIGCGKEISFDQLVLKGQGDTGIIVSEKFFPLHDARVYQCSDPVTESSEEENDWDDSNIGMFECSEPGCVKSFQTFSELESHLDVGDHCVKDERPSETLNDKL